MSGDLAQALLFFAASAILMVLSSTFLAKYGDALAGLMGWGRLWAGTILVAIATSLPELLTNITAAGRGQPELAGGIILGGSMINMFVLAMVALLFGGGRFFRQVAPEQKFLASVAILLTVLAVLVGVVHVGVSLWEVGLASVIVLAVYLGGMRLVYATRPHEAARPAGGNPANGPGRGRAWGLFSLAALGVILAAPVLAYSGEQIADATGISASFIGVVAIAIVASAPEASTAIAAVRIGAADLAVGTLYGSCAFDILILGLADPFYRDGTLLETLEPSHLAAGMIAILLMSLGLWQIVLRGSSRRIPAVPTLVLMVLAYAGGLYAVYSLS